MSQFKAHEFKLVVSVRRSFRSLAQTLFVNKIAGQRDNPCSSHSSQRIGIYHFRLTLGFAVESIELLTDTHSVPLINSIIFGTGTDDLILTDDLPIGGDVKVVD